MIKRIAQALGFAAILLLPNYVGLTSSMGDERMHVPWPLTRTALAQLADLAIVALLFAILMAILRKLKLWPRLRWALLALLPVFLLIRNVGLIPFHISCAAIFAISLTWIAALFILNLRASSIATRFYALASAALTGFAVFAAVIVWQLVSAAQWRPAIQSFANPIAMRPASKPRLVWIIFDELAYRPAFESRDPSLNLPNFDRLRSQSTLYSRVTPIGDRTEHVVPSLILGRVVTDSTDTAAGLYLVRTTDSPRWQSFDVGASLFGMAKQQGVATSIVGWYINYCPIFSNTAAECYWANDDSDEGAPPSFPVSYAGEVWFPLRILVEQFLAPAKAWADVARWNAQGHIASVKDVSTHALATLATSQADIIYLHIPAPHPPEFWNRRTGSFAPGGSYLDSLDYSDRLLGRMLDTLQSQPRWQATTLIVQGDHSWRTYIWRSRPGWSAEDERISHGGQWDPRPVVMIHTPGQQSPGTVSAVTRLMFVHDFVAGQIHTLAR